MQNTKLKFSSELVLGSALFGLFFGAGNIIFPIQIGQAAGPRMLLATLGFLVTAAGLPFLGILALAQSETRGVYELASRAGSRYAMLFTLLLYLTIGPFFALPRTASVAYEIAFASYLPTWMLQGASIAFTFIFFAAAYFIARNPQKIISVVGRYLNPIFVGLIAVVVLATIIFPMGNIFNTVALPPYDTMPFVAGALSGYETMDGLAALAFGVLVINAVKDMGIKGAKPIARSIVISGVFVLWLMGIIYTCLIYMGASSTGSLPVAENGGIALAQIINHYFGIFGAIVLALIVILACLKTAIGLITACSEMFNDLFPAFSYRQYMIVVTGFSFFVANFGLTSIIEFAKPVLLFIYPLSISLILLGLFETRFNRSKTVYQITMFFVTYASLADFLAAFGPIVGDQNIQHIGLLMQQTLPFSDVGLGWIVPFALGVTLGTYVYMKHERKEHERKLRNDARKREAEAAKGKRKKSKKTK